MPSSIMSAGRAKGHRDTGCNHSRPRQAARRNSQAGKRLLVLHVGRRRQPSTPAKLHKIAKKYLDLKRLIPDAGRASKASLLTDVKLFEKASLAGEYYQSFDVNSKNCTQESTGTSAWIARSLRLLDRCVANASKGDPMELREAMDILFGLLDRIDECRDDIVFFADEGGAWQVGVDWDRVLPAWFKVLSATAGPESTAGMQELSGCRTRAG